MKTIINLKKNFTMSTQNKDKEKERQLFRKRIRSKVIRRDKFKCRTCGSKNKITVHHIESLAKYNKENDHETGRSLKNLVTLCEACHDFAPNGNKEYLLWEEERKNLNKLFANF